ncbi:MAG: Rrf2 family transcriptional regulator [Bilifractor sp.]
MQITSKFTIAIHILACIDYFHGKIPVNSGLLSQSIGANPVIVRGVMSVLNKAGMINAGKGRNDATLKKPLAEVTFYDIYEAVDETAEKGIFHFHENPSPDCPVGRNIHKALDGELLKVQHAMEDEMKKIPVSAVTEEIRKDIQLEG